MIRWSWLPCVLVLAVFLTGCQHVPWGEDIAGRPAPTPRTPAERVPVSLPAPDLTALEGRVIALDPGHGGEWPGAVAPANNLRESDVNLDVALRLYTLLSDAGADVILTRTGDYAVDASGLGADLAARPGMANEAGADVFVSIHHNAEIADNPTRDDLEVYYKLSDDGPSLDLAQALMAPLAHDFRPHASAKRLLPGNYRVLREASMPAVLLESAYLTHAPSAAELARPETLDRQAVAIAEGLAGYFALAPPQVVDHELSSHPFDERRRIRLAFAAGNPIDGATVRAEVNGESRPGVWRQAPGGGYWMFDEPLPNGSLNIRITGRNHYGAAFAHAFRADVNREPASIQVTQTPPAVNGGGQAAFTVRVQDRHGLPIKEGAEVRMAPGGRRAFVRDGAARFYMDARGLPDVLTFEAGGESQDWRVRRGGEDHRSVEVVDRNTGGAVAGARITAGAPVTSADANGWAALPWEATQVTVSAPGYFSADAALNQAHTRVRLEPVANGALHGRTICLDPAHGGRVTGAVGPRGQRAADASLDVAQRVAAMLNEAGAVAVLSREGDRERTDLDRVVTAEEAGSDLFIRLTFGEGQARPVNAADPYAPQLDRPFLAHYPGSTGGERLARAIGQRLGVSAIEPSYGYVLQQTSCPAIIVQPGDFAAPAVEQRFREPGARHDTAEAVYQGIVAYFVR